MNSSEIQALKFDNFFITARKRSLRRLCFHRCLSTREGGSWSLSRRGLHPGGSPSQGGLCPGGFCPGEVSVQGFSVQGFSVQGGYLSRGVSVQVGSLLGRPLVL